MVYHLFVWFFWKFVEISQMRTHLINQDNQMFWYCHRDASIYAYCGWYIAHHTKSFFIQQYALGALGLGIRSAWLTLTLLGSDCRVSRSHEGSIPILISPPAIRGRCGRLMSYSKKTYALGSGCLVNGMAVNAFLRLIERRSMFFYHQLPRVFAVNSTLLSTNDVVAAGAGLDSAELVLFPLHLPRLGPYGHWALLFASIRDSTVTAYESNSLPWSFILKTHVGKQGKINIWQPWGQFCLEEFWPLLAYCWSFWLLWEVIYGHNYMLHNLRRR